MATGDAALLERFKPILRYDSQGSFFADSAAEMTDRVAANGRGNTLQRHDGTVLAGARPSAGQAQLDLAFLGAGQYADGTSVRDDDNLDAVGRDYVLAARQLHAQAAYANRIHAHVAREDGKAWLQYWFFYYYNDKAFLGFGLHEGDWEMVQVGLGTNGAPQVMTFAQHDHGERVPWASAERQGDRPVVYVARGSQASYPRAGRHRAPIVPDQADGRGATMSTAALELLDGPAPPWVGWPGRWGSTRAGNAAESDSPRGPRRHDQWSRPAEFNEDAVERAALTGAVLGAPELKVAPPPRIRAVRVGDHAVVTFAFRRPRRDEAPARQVVLSVDSPDDDLPPATYAFRIDSQQGEIEHPLRLEEDRRYVVRGSGATREGVPGDTVETRLRDG